MVKGVQIPLHPVIETKESSRASVKGAPQRVYWSEAETLDAKGLEVFRDLLATEGHAEEVQRVADPAELVLERHVVPIGHDHLGRGARHAPAPRRRLDPPRRLGHDCGLGRQLRPLRRAGRRGLSQELRADDPRLRAQSPARAQGDGPVQAQPPIQAPLGTRHKLLLLYRPFSLVRHYRQQWPVETVGMLTNDRALTIGLIAALITVSVHNFVDDVYVHSLTSLITLLVIALIRLERVTPDV